MTESKIPKLDVSLIRMVAAEILEFHVIQPHPPISLDNAYFRVHHNHLLLKSSKPDELGVRATFLIELLNDSEEVLTTCDADILFGFSVPILKDFTTGEPPSKIDTTLQLSLLTLAYSTARGMISIQTRGTLFERFFLPVLPPSALIGRKQEESETELNK